MATRRNSRETYFLAVIRCTLQHPERCLSLDEPTCYQVSAKSVQHTIFSGVAHLDRMHFDVVLRKLISQQQACPHCIDKSTVSRLCQTVEFDDEVLVGRTLPRRTVFHEAPHQSPQVIELRIKCSEGVPDTLKSKLILVLKFALFG